MERRDLLIGAVAVGSLLAPSLVEARPMVISNPSEACAKVYKEWQINHHDLKITEEWVIKTKGLSQGDTDILKEMVDLAKADPDFTVYTNYEVICLDPQLQKQFRFVAGGTKEDLEALQKSHMESLQSV